DLYGPGAVYSGTFADGDRLGLTGQQVWLLTSVTSTQGLLAYLRLDDTNTVNGTVLAEDVGATTAILNAGAGTRSVPGHLGGGLILDGIGDSISLPTVALSAQQGTVMLWLRRQFPTPDSDRVIVDSTVAKIRWNATTANL